MVFKVAEFKNLFYAQITLSSCFGLISVRDELNLANSGGLKYTPLHHNRFRCGTVNKLLLLQTDWLSECFIHLFI